MGVWKPQAPLARPKTAQVSFRFWTALNDHPVLLLALRCAGALTEEHAGVVARVITPLILPALVFNHLSAHPILFTILFALLAGVNLVTTLV